MVAKGGRKGVGVGGIMVVVGDFRGETFGVSRVFAVLSFELWVSSGYVRVIDIIIADPCPWPCSFSSFAQFVLSSYLP